MTPDGVDDPNHAMWLGRWDEGRIGFHEPLVNGWLTHCADDLVHADGGVVLIPLCGKTVDIPWLIARDVSVVGVELAKRAVEDLHAENRIEAAVTTEGAQQVWRSPGLTIYQGDFFALDPSVVGPCDAVWDRAAMIALPPEQRGAYVEHVMRFLRPGARVLLVALVYDESKMDGPPYAVPTAEVESGFSRHARVVKIGTRDVTTGNPRFVRSGLDEVHEVAFLITARE
ncbi:MAG: thiopurine S-methyltransferase [Planctomycetes bacterium]|nr:thiopurine S-methyltransferase [Planctomycetota bacterium]